MRRWRDDPAAFVEEALGLRLFPWQATMLRERVRHDRRPAQERVADAFQDMLCYGLGSLANVDVVLGESPGTSAMATMVEEMRALERRAAGGWPSVEDARKDMLRELLKRAGR